MVGEEALEDIGFEEDVLGDFEGVLLLVVVVDGPSVGVEGIASVVEGRPDVVPGPPNRALSIESAAVDPVDVSALAAVCWEAVDEVGVECVVGIEACLIRFSGTRFIKRGCGKISVISSIAKASVRKFKLKEMIAREH